MTPTRLINPRSETATGAQPARDDGHTTVVHQVDAAHGAQCSTAAGGGQNPTSTRRGDWKQTFTGKQFYFLDPRPEDIDIRDIAHALSNIVRYGGHSPGALTVAQHSVMVSRRVAYLAMEEPRRQWLQLRLAALLHDAHEAYWGDIVRPLKRMLPVEFHDALAATDEAIARRFGFSPDLFLHPLIKQADEELLATEAEIHFPPEKRPAPWKLRAQPLDADTRRKQRILVLAWDGRGARDDFQGLFEELTVDGRAPA